MSATFIAITVLSVITFIMFWLDKKFAVGNHWRIPERTLMFMASVGGSAGALIAMEFFRHKTSKEPFPRLIPRIIIIQLVIYIVIANIFL